ncbi:hypothetical protein [Dyadobacter sp. CY312]|uniref:hypothetical protein n=1 Tax=Dyadobacter sp. CY312 TaxID=2907303 RepID=UPI001F2B91EA|nr:hypothetical protein [Dyadobacter sp. CY312]MCE7039185.1 hypothetical protein [Dyadobacter sp. CY312]
MDRIILFWKKLSIGNKRLMSILTPLVSLLLGRFFQDEKFEETDWNGDSFDGYYYKTGIFSADHFLSSFYSLIGLIVLLFVILWIREGYIKK